jgi:hypothetical protein
MLQGFRVHWLEAGNWKQPQPRPQKHILLSPPPMVSITLILAVLSTLAAASPAASGTKRSTGRLIESFH